MRTHPWQWAGPVGKWGAVETGQKGLKTALDRAVWGLETPKGVCDDPLAHATMPPERKLQTIQNTAKWVARGQNSGLGVHLGHLGHSEG